MSSNLPSVANYRLPQQEVELLSQDDWASTMSAWVRTRAQQVSASNAIEFIEGVEALYRSEFHGGNMQSTGMPTWESGAPALAALSQWAHDTSSVADWRSPVRLGPQAVTTQLVHQYLNQHPMLIGAEMRFPVACASGTPDKAPLLESLIKSGVVLSSKRLQDFSRRSDIHAAELQRLLGRGWALPEPWDAVLEQLQTRPDTRNLHALLDGGLPVPHLSSVLPKIASALGAMFATPRSDFDSLVQAIDKLIARCAATADAMRARSPSGPSQPLEPLARSADFLVPDFTTPGTTTAHKNPLAILVISAVNACMNTRGRTHHECFTDFQTPLKLSLAAVNKCLRPENRLEPVEMTGANRLLLVLGSDNGYSTTFRRGLMARGIAGSPEEIEAELRDMPPPSDSDGETPPYADPLNPRHVVEWLVGLNTEHPLTAQEIDAFDEKWPEAMTPLASRIHAIRADALARSMTAEIDRLGVESQSLETPASSATPAKRNTGL